MEFATKKECAGVLAFLAEESWRNARIQRRSCPFFQVSWVDGRILTVRQAGEHLLLRVSAVLKDGQEEAVEQLLEAAAMREGGDYCFSTRRVCGFLLAEVSVYVRLSARKESFEVEYRRLFTELNQVLKVSS